MSNYDTYGNVQLKVYPLLSSPRPASRMNHYRIGDTVPIGDGVYVTSDGVVVVINGKFVANFYRLISKWGEDISPTQIADPHKHLKSSVDTLTRELARGIAQLKTQGRKFVTDDIGKHRNKTRKKASCG